MAEDFEFQLLAQKQYEETGAGEISYTGETCVDPNDGSIYEWDVKRKGWFPKVDDDFLAAYHAGYGVPSAGETSTIKRDASGFAIPPMPTSKCLQPPNPSLNPSPNPSPQSVSTASDFRAVPATGTKRENVSDEGCDQSQDVKKMKPSNDQTAPTWFEIDEDKNNNMYVSGLPLDITLDEYKDLMKKCGIVAEDDNGNAKLKLYRDSEGEIKGDGLCCYLKNESVSLAIQLLDKSQYRGRTISVERAKFVQKGEYNPTLKKKKKKSQKKKGNKQERLLDWRVRKMDGSTRKKCERIIVFRNVFDPKEFDEDPTLITDIRNDLQEECSKFGAVKKIMLFDRHPEGIASLAFAEFEAADMCVLKMDQRWYGGKQLSVAPWDGITNFHMEETDQERTQRLEKWEEFLVEEDVKEEGSDDSKAAVSTTQE